MGVIRKYNNHKLQTNPWHCEEELQDIFSNKTPKMQLKQRNQLSRPRQDEYKTRKVKVMHTKTKTNTDPPETMGGA